MPHTNICSLSCSVNLVILIFEISAPVELVYLLHIISSVQWLSRVLLLATPWTAARQASLSITNSPRILKLMSIELVMPSNHLILCLSPFSCLQSFPASGPFPMSQFFTSGGQIYWSFSFSISPSNEYSGLISFRMDWLDFLAVQGMR